MPCVGKFHLGAGAVGSLSRELFVVSTEESEDVIQARLELGMIARGKVPREEQASMAYSLPERAVNGVAGIGVPLVSLFRLTKATSVEKERGKGSVAVLSRSAAINQSGEAALSHPYSSFA